MGLLPMQLSMWPWASPAMFLQGREGLGLHSCHARSPDPAHALEGFKGRGPGRVGSWTALVPWWRDRVARDCLSLPGFAQQKAKL